MGPSFRYRSDSDPGTVLVTRHSSPARPPGNPEVGHGSRPTQRGPSDHQDRIPQAKRRGGSGTPTGRIGARPAAGRSRWDNAGVRWKAAIGSMSGVALLLIPGCGGSQGALRSPTSSTGHSSTTAVTMPSRRPTTPTTGMPQEPPTSTLPSVTIASWTGREPVRIYFSGDGGNVATGLTWSLWSQTVAVGHGVRDELGCVPDCAQGSSTPYPVTLTLSDPVGGVFVSLLEQTADSKGTAETFQAPNLAQGVCPTASQASCVFAGQSSS
jgi:hypothetical protein